MTDGGGFSRRDLFRRLGAKGKQVARASVPKLDPTGVLRGTQNPDSAQPVTPPVAATSTGETVARSRRRVFPLHRPPGAIEEEAFLEACTKCGDCAAACPHDAIIPGSARLDRAARTPTIVPLNTACQMCPDTPCITACEPRALRLEQPLKMAEARIQPWACLAYQGTFCSVCREQCPVPGAIKVDEGKPVILDDICTGCGVCQHVCPAPESAILLMPVAVRLTVSAGTDSAGAESNGTGDSNSNGAEA